MKTYTLPVIGLMTLGASAFAAAAPSTGNSLPARDNFSACKWLGDRFKWFNSERDHKNPYVQEFNVSLRMQYGLDWIDPNGEGRVMGEKEGNGRRFNDEWRRFRAGFNMKFLNNFKINNVWNIGGMDDQSILPDWLSLSLSITLSLGAFMTINIGIFNLLPLPALDGGRLLFLIIEAVRRKPVKPEHEGKIGRASCRERV